MTRVAPTPRTITRRLAARPGGGRAPGRWGRPDQPEGGGAAPAADPRRGGREALLRGTEGPLAGRRGVSPGRAGGGRTCLLREGAGERGQRGRPMTEELVPCPPAPEQTGSNRDGNRARLLPAGPAVSQRNHLRA